MIVILMAMGKSSAVAGRVTAGTTTRAIAACTQGNIDITVTASPISGPTFDIAGRDKNRYYDVSSIGGGGGGSSSNEHPSSLVGGIKANFVNIKTHDNINSSGGSGTDIKEIESYVRRTLRSSNYINPNELGIVLGTSAFRIRISLHIIDHGGNLRDCVLLAACAALADLRLPTIVVNEDGIVSIVKTNDDSDDDEMMAEIDKSNGQTSSKRRRRKGGKSLSLGPLPVPLTIAILPPSTTTTTDQQQQSILLADPTRLEENVSGGNIVTAVCNTNEEIVSYHKGGGGSGSGGYVTMEQMAAIAIMGFGRAKELEELVLGHR